MRNLRIILILYALSFAFFANAQTISDTSVNASNVGADSTQHLKSLRFISGEYTKIQVDALENIYLLNAAGVVKKLNANGDSIGVYNDVKNFGKPGAISVANPLQVLVYYPVFGSVVLLDRFITERSRLNLRSVQLFSVGAIASSYDNNIWVFDDQNFQLKKIDADGKLLLATNDLRTFLNIIPQPKKIIDVNNFVILYDKNTGIFIFDRYGTYIKHLPVTDWENVGAFKNYVFGFKAHSINLVNTSTNKSLALNLTNSTILDAAFMNGNFYLLEKGGVSIYKTIANVE